MSTRENWMSSMPGRSVWTRPMLERLQELHRQGHNEHDITNTLFLEFGAPSKIGETKAELMMLKTGPKPSQWNSTMEHRVKEYHARGMDANDITTELFHEFAKPESGYWQETYRKLQQMKLRGDL